ncbi:MAG: phosphatidylcholine/phosphatidylserine synthase [Anaerolineae bacterium]|nr:phosphatidylcholine/phosphatidylserine synthase [Anaerolineae bacterium]
MIIKRDLAALLEEQPISRRRVWAWGVHLFTATGAVWGLLSLLAIQQHDWALAFVWMGLALFVDGFDGTLARLFGVKGMLPQFDGALLDNIVDYFTYVVVPAYFIVEANLMPTELHLFGAIVIVLASAYQFCQADAKTEDHFFKGFPSMWNAVVIYLFLLALNPWVNLAIIVLCGILVFVPTKYAYPTRMTRYKRLTMGMIGIWGVMMVTVLLMYPVYPIWLVWISLFIVIYYVAVSRVTSLPPKPRRV